MGTSEVENLSGMSHVADPSRLSAMNRAEACWRSHCLADTREDLLMIQISCKRNRRNRVRAFRPFRSGLLSQVDSYPPLKMP